LRLLVVSQYFWPETFGINALVRELQARGAAVTVLTGQPNYPDGDVFPGYSFWRMRCENYEGAQVLRLPLLPRGKRSGIRLAVNYLSFVAAGVLLGPWLLRGRSFDAVLVYAPSPLLQALPAIFLAWLKRAPLAVWVQDLWPESLTATGFIKNRAILTLVEAVIRYIYRHTDNVLVPSEAFRDPIKRLTRFPERISYYPNAYIAAPDVQPVAPPEVQALAQEIERGFSVVFAGNLGAAQSLETIVGAAEQLERAGVPIRIFLIGSGSQSDWLDSEIQRRALTNVVIPGRFPPESMACFYAAASALLVSLRDEPIFALTIPSKVQGYLAAGRPIIASLNGEGARIVQDAGAGVSCSAGDAAALAAAAVRLFEAGEDARREMGENGRRYAERQFSLDGLANELIAQLETLSGEFRRKVQ
jgi:glycosyltransferase involved in cell wall biosynthesis